MPIQSFNTHILTASRLMISNLWFILTRSNTVAVRFALYSGAILWGIQDFLLPARHFVAISSLLSIHIDYVISFVRYFLPFGLIAYGTTSLLCLLLKFKSYAITLQSSLAGAFFFTLAVNLEMAIHYLVDGSMIVEVPLWYAAGLAWWILIRDLTKRNRNGS
jgi:hypothetical protein